MAMRQTDLGALVDVDNGLIGRELFSSEDLYRRELETIFTRAWLFVGHESLVPKPGDYYLSRMGEESVILCRDRDGKIHVFLNSCTHRGMKVCRYDQGNTRVFTCPYHAWSYGLDGSLKAIPGEEGFPGLATEDHGLVEVSAIEKGGLVYVMQKGDISPEMLENSRDYFSPGQQLFKQSENTDQANWKLLTETLLEGYHIKSLHKKSFYPYGLDNVNLVETYGANTRVTFPFRRIEKLRDVPADKRRASGMLTSVYHLFPNASVSVLSKHSNLTIMEPLSPSSTQMVIYLVTPDQTVENPIPLEDVERDAQFVNESGQDEDREAACLIQQTVTAEANSHLTFGYFEKAIVNFHKHLSDRIFNLKG